MRQFRNFAELELEIPDAGVVLVGENGAGKTNLLEAIYYLEIFRSFRNAPDAQLVRFGAEAFHIRGRFGASRGTEITAAFEPRTQRKRATVDGVEPDRVGDAIGRAGIVVFSPSDVDIVAGAPGERRRFLDIVLSLGSPGYLAALQRYRHALRQRNALLRQGATQALLETWDEALVPHGARIVARRREWTRHYAGAFADRYRAIAGGTAGLLEYRPSLPLEGEAGDDDVDDGRIADIFRAELDRVRQRDRERGMTTVGPHRDDFALLFEAAHGWSDLRAYGSGGQRRTAAVALRMVEARTIRTARSVHPIVLLDDVFAELDATRARRILELLEAEERGQVVLTAPKLGDLELRGGTLPVWRIHAGQVSR